MATLTTTAPFYFSFKRYIQVTTLLLSTAFYPLLCFGASDGHLSMGMLTATKKIDDKHTLYFGGGTLVENFKGEIATIGVAGKLTKAISWQSAYFIYSARSQGEERHYDHRLRGSLTYKHDFGEWRFSHRSRVEYRRGDVLDGFRYRPAFNLSHPLSVVGIKLRPYIEYEPFYDFRKHANTLSLYSAGAIIPVHQRVTLIAAYFHIHNQEDSTHTFGPQIMLNIQL